MNRRRIDRGTATAKGSRLKSAAIALLKTAGVASVTLSIGYGAWFLSGWLRTSDRFAVRHLVFAGTKHSVQEELVRRAGLVAGTNIFSIDLSAAAHAMEQESWVHKVRIVRDLPDTLKIDVEEHRTALVAECGGLCLVDEEGVTFKRAVAADGLDFPLVTGVPREALEKGDPDGLLKQALGIAGAYRAAAMEDRAPLAELHLDLEASLPRWTIHCGDEAVEVQLGELDPGDAGELSGVLARLRRVWDELDRRGARARSIDVGNRQRPEWVAARLE